MPVDSVRSRSGCVTCRSRRKKCDELFTQSPHEGSCQRCYAGSFECKRTAHPPRRRTKPKAESPGLAQVESSSTAASPAAFEPFAQPNHSPLATTSQLFPLPLPHPPIASTSASAYAPHPFPEIGVETLASFFESLDSIPSDAFAAAAAGQLGAPSSEISMGMDALETAVGGPPNHSSSSSAGDGPAEGSAVSPLYARFNDDYLQSLPGPVRKLISSRLSNVASSHELTRAASLALVLLYRVRSQPEGGPEAQAKLIEQSDKYFQQALLHLEAPIPLEAQLIAVLDLQFHQHDQAGATAAYSILLIGEFFVTEALGVNPPLDFSSLSGVSNIALRCYGYADVLATVSLKNRRTVFSIVGLPGDAPSPPPDDARQTGDVTFDRHLGLPVGLLLCLAATSNLSVDMVSMNPATVREKSDKIEATIRSWRPSGPTSGQDSVTYIEELKTSEMWRHAALIHLFQSVHNLGPLHPLLCHSLAQILTLGVRTAEPSEDSLWAGSVRACPWFMGATVAQAADRAQCRKGLGECGPQKGYADNLEAAETIWRAVDASGWPLRWKDVLEKEALFVAFL